MLTLANISCCIIASCASTSSLDCTYNSRNCVYRKWWYLTLLIVRLNSYRYVFYFIWFFFIYRNVFTIIDTSRWSLSRISSSWWFDKSSRLPSLLSISSQSSSTINNPFLILATSFCALGLGNHCQIYCKNNNVLPPEFIQQRFAIISRDSFCAFSIFSISSIDLSAAWLCNYVPSETSLLTLNSHLIGWISHRITHFYFFGWCLLFKRKIIERRSLFQNHVAVLWLRCPRFSKHRHFFIS